MTAHPATLRAHKDELRAAATALLEAVTEDELRDASETIAEVYTAWLQGRPTHALVGELKGGFGSWPGTLWLARCSCGQECYGEGRTGAERAFSTHVAEARAEVTAETTCPGCISGAYDGCRQQGLYDVPCVGRWVQR